MRVHIISSKSDFMALQESWNDLLLKSNTPNPFMLWEWQYQWWDIYENKKFKLFLLAVEEAGELIGLAPFYIYQNKLLGTHALKLIGNGELTEEQISSFYTDIIIEDGRQIQVLDALSDYLYRRRYLWNAIKTENVKADSAINVLAKLLCGQDARVLYSSDSQYYIDFPESIDEYMAKIGKSTRKNIRSKRNRLEKEGGVEVKTADDFDEPMQAFEVLKALHIKRMQKDEEDVVFDSASFTAFHEKVLPTLLAQGWADIRIMYFAGEPMAGIYNLEMNGVVYSYMSGFYHPDERRYSPLTAFDFIEFERLIEGGYKRYDFLGADSTDSYKDTYKCNRVPIYEIRYFRPTKAGFFNYLLSLGKRRASDIRSLSYTPDDGIKRRRASVKEVWHDLKNEMYASVKIMGLFSGMAAVIMSLVD